MEFFDSRMKLTAELVRWMHEYAKQEKLQFLNEQAKRFMYCLYSNEARPRQCELMTEGLKKALPDLEQAIGRMRNKDHIAKSRIAYARIERAIPDLIPLWENYSELKFALTETIHGLGRVVDCIATTSVAEKKLFEIRSQARSFMPAPKISYDELKAFINELESFDKKHLKREVGKSSYYAFDGLYSDFKNSIGRLEVISLMESA
jgi:hypothetical protein